MKELSNCLAVLQAGGKGTRMRELTGDRLPKPLLKLGGRPMLEWQILNLSRYGIRDFVIIVGHLGNMIEEYFQDGRQWNVHIRYIYEQTPLGSGGALYYLKGMMGHARHIVLTLGDVMFDVDMPRMVAFHEDSGAAVTLLVHPNAHPQDSDLVVLDKDSCVVCFDAKTNHRDYWYENCVNAGIYLLEPGVVASLEEARQRDLEKEIFLPYMEKGMLYGYRTPEYVKDVGTVERFQAAERELAAGTWKRRNLEQSQRCVFLDRDGTLNRYVGLLSKAEQLELEKNAAEAVRLLNTSGYLAIVVTNQPVVARGMCTIEGVQEIHRKLAVLLGREGAYLDDIVFCPHHPDKGYLEENPIYKVDCECRKPKTGMVDAMVNKYHIDRSQSWMIGDGFRDIECGHRARLKTILVQTGESKEARQSPLEPDFIAADVLAAVKKIIGED